MADVKFTGLPAASGIPDNGSLVAISTYDGVSAYTSEKYTMTQLKDIVYVMEAEDKISFDSSGTNKTMVDDSNSGFRIELDTYGGDEFVMSFDGAGTTSDYSRGWMYEDPNGYGFGFGDGVTGVSISTNGVSNPAGLGAFFLVAGSKGFYQNTTGIGFFDTTPVAQPTTGIAEATFVENAGGTAVNVDSTFGGYTLQQIAQSLQNLGLIA